MAQSTPRLGLTKPEGSDQITVLTTGPPAVRDSFDVLDNAAIYGQSVHSLRPSPSIAGRLWRSTDTGEIAVDTGSVWLRLAVSQVPTGDIADGAVTTAKIGDGQVTAGKLASGAAETAKINDLAVTAGKLAAGAVTTAKIGDGQVTAGKLASGAVDASKIAGGGQVSITSLTLANGWSYSGASHHVPSAALDQMGWIHLRGLVAGGSAARIATLPAGLRPSAAETFTVGAFNTATAVPVSSTFTVTVASGGEVVANTTGLGANIALSLSGITFRP